MSTVPPTAVSSPRPMTNAQLDQLSINCIRTLSMDAVQQAKSGHSRLHLPGKAINVGSSVIRTLTGCLEDIAVSKSFIIVLFGSVLCFVVPMSLRNADQRDPRECDGTYSVQ
jgi:hypothetical protein